MKVCVYRLLLIAVCFLHNEHIAAAGMSPVKLNQEIRNIKAKMSLSFSKWDNNLIKDIQGQINTIKKIAVQEAEPLQQVLDDLINKWQLFQADSGMLEKSKEENRALQNRYDKTTLEISKLKEELAIFETNVAQEKQSKELAETKSKELGATITSLQKDNEQLSATAQKITHESAALKKTFETTQKNLKELQDEKLKIEQSFNAMNQQNEAITKSVQTLKAELDASLQEIEKSRHELELRTQQNKAIGTQAGVIKNESEAIKKEAADLKKETEVLRAHNNKLGASLTKFDLQLGEKIKNAQLTQEGLRKQIIQHEAHNKKLLDDLKKEQDAVAGADLEIIKLQDQIIKSDTALKKAHKQINDQKLVAQKNMAENLILETTLKKLNKDFKALQNKKDEEFLKQELAITRLKKENLDLTQATREKIRDNEIKIKEGIDGIKQLESKNLDLQSKITSLTLEFDAYKTNQGVQLKIIQEAQEKLIAEKNAQVLSIREKMVGMQESLVTYGQFKADTKKFHLNIKDTLDKIGKLLETTFKQAEEHLIGKNLTAMLTACKDNDLSTVNQSAKQLTVDWGQDKKFFNEAVDAVKSLDLVIYNQLAKIASLP